MGIAFISVGGKIIAADSKYGNLATASQRYIDIGVYIMIGNIGSTAVFLPGKNRYMGEVERL